jgi:hypothetical protein
LSADGIRITDLSTDISEAMFDGIIFDLNFLIGGNSLGSPSPRTTTLETYRR